MEWETALVACSSDCTKKIEKPCINFSDKSVMNNSLLATYENRVAWLNRDALPTCNVQYLPIGCTYSADRQIFSQNQTSVQQISTSSD